MASPRAASNKSKSSSSSRLSKLPKNWPADIKYLSSPHYLDSIPRDALVALHTMPTPTSPIITIVPKPSHPISHVRITPITLPSHPAHHQHGLFATTNLKPDQLIVPYTGIVHATLPPSSSPPSPPATATPSLSRAPKPQPQAEDEESNYTLSLGPRDLHLAIDAARAGNEARFVNDFRGVRAGGPNAEFRDVWVRASSSSSSAAAAVSAGGGAGRAGGAGVERWMGIFVLGAGKSGRGKGGIKKGEEIVVSYGKGFWKARAGCDESKG